MRDWSDQEQPSVLGAAWEYKWLVVGIAVVVTLAATVFSISRPDRYEASASIIFENLTSALGQSASGPAERAVANELEILRSGAVAERTIEILEEQSIEDISFSELRRELIMSGLADADVITIAFVGETPDLAETVTNAAITAYQDVRGVQRDLEAEQNLARLDAAERLLLDDLAAVRSDLSELRAERGFDLMLDTVLDEMVTVESRLLEQISADEREALIVRQAQLQSQLQALGTALEIESDRVDIEALLRQENQVLDRLVDLAERRSEIEVEQNTRSSAVAFISPPTITALESGAGKVLTSLAGAVLGLLVGLAIAYALVTNRRTFADRMEPARVLNTPYLADVPKFDPVSDKTKLPVRDNPRSPVAEAFRFAASSLELQLNRMGAQTVVAVSGLVGDGKSTIIANTAMAAARAGKRVLVVDADFGNQSISRMLLGDFRLGPGLTELVSGKALLAEAAIPVSLGHGAILDVMGRGKEPVSAPSVFSSPDIRAVIDRMTDRYDIVFLDGPPLTQVAYGSALARLADTALVVVTHGSSIRKAEDLTRQVAMVDIPLVGYVYNKAAVRSEMLVSGGSMKDVIGDAGTTEPLRAES